MRDGCLIAHTLAELGATSEARRFLDFLHRHLRLPPQPLIGLGGEHDLPEWIHPSWEGWEGNGPVRIGNAAAAQVQLDAPGQILWLADRLGWREDLAWIEDLVGELIPWQPDNGIWEFRGRPAVHLHTQLWVALGLRAGERLLHRPLGAAAHTRRLLDRDWFPQAIGREVADASSLLFGLLDLVEPTDPRFLTTLRRCEEELEVAGLMRRYVAEDDFGQTTSTFSICTLWWIEALDRSGQRQRAGELLAAFRERGNHLGLFAEDIDPSRGEQLGNFPQGYTHLGILRALRALEG